MPQSLPATSASHGAKPFSCGSFLVLLTCRRTCISKGLQSPFIDNQPRSQRAQDRQMFSLDFKDKPEEKRQSLEVATTEMEWKAEIRYPVEGKRCRRERKYSTRQTVRAHPETGNYSPTPLS